MELVNSKKLFRVAKFMCNVEVDENYLCGSFLEHLNGAFNAPKCEDDGAFCMKNCPMKSIEAFIKWLKTPDSEYDVSNLKRPQQEDFIGYDNHSNSLLDKDGYIKALEEYYYTLGDALTDAEYSLEEVKCENEELQEMLEKIRGVLDGKD